MTRLAIAHSRLPGAPAANALAIDPILVVLMAGASVLRVRRVFLLFVSGSSMGGGAMSLVFLPPRRPLATGAIWAAAKPTVTTADEVDGAVGSSDGLWRYPLILASSVRFAAGQLLNWAAGTAGNVGSELTVFRS